MTELRIGGVPEHFNWPWQRVIDGGELAALGVAARWTDFPDGSGAMIAALEEDRLDVAMLLTEAAVAGIARRGRYRIVSLYTESPLLWGVHVPAGSAFTSVDELRNARFAISRLGSGSHLMSYVLARERGWPADGLRFVTVKTLEGAVAAFEAGEADVFLWEKLMTKPLVDAGKFRRVGELAAPWPGFVACATARALTEKRDAVRAAIEGVCRAAARVAADPSSPAAIAARYGLREPDVAEWLRTTRWATRPAIDDAVVERVSEVLRELRLVDAPVPPSAAIAREALPGL
ncbi:MAG TPA: PhnD/SsuA/transferrin family substrate-binding protein [Gammaproteobacteria bacterium]